MRRIGFFSTDNGGMDLTRRSAWLASDRMYRIESQWYKENGQSFN